MVCEQREREKKAVELKSYGTGYELKRRNEAPGRRFKMRLINECLVVVALDRQGVVGMCMCV